MGPWCASEAKRDALSPRRDFDAVMWNMEGLHHLHLLPARPETARNGKTTVGTLTTAAEFAESLSECAAVISTRFPRSRVFYSLTNHVCASKFTGKYAAAANAWAAKTADARYDMQMTSVGVATLREAERVAAARSGQAILDPENDGLCECTARGDGRHFTDADPAALARLAEGITE